jgi:ABC-type lipoprotein release transport system permease subunit
MSATLRTGYAPDVRGLHSVAWRGLKRRKARSILTGFAIALGVANVFGVFSTNASIDRGLEQRALAYAGTDASAFNANPEGHDTSALVDSRATLLALSDVREVSYSWGALPLDEPTPLKHEEVYLTGHDAVARRFFYGGNVLRGRLPRSDTTDAALSEGSAKALGVDIGDTVTTHRSTFLANRKEHDAMWPNTANLAARLPDTLTFHVTGILRDPPASDENVCCGNAASLEYIWRVLGVTAANEVDFHLNDGVDTADWVQLNEADLPDLRIESSVIAPEFERFITTLKGTLSGTSALALFIGAFLIYLTFSISIVERTRLLGTFHAIGAPARSVAAGVLTEALAIGVVSTIAGLVLGYGLSFGLARLVGRIVPLAISTAPTITSPGFVAAIVVGLIATFAGAAVPAIRAARMSPVQAIRGTDSHLARRSRGWIFGVLLIALGIAFALHGSVSTNIVTVFTTLGVLTGAILVVPPLLGMIARGVRRFAGRLTPGLGDVSVGHVTRERNRSAYILALLMIVLAAMLALSSTDRSLHAVADTWIDKRFGADLFLYGPEITSKVERQLERVSGVTSVTSIDIGSRVVIDRPKRVTQNLVTIDPQDFFDIAGFPWAEGDDASVRAALTRGGSVLITSRTAELLGVHVGDPVRIRFAGAYKRFTIAGIYSTLSSGPEVGLVASLADASFFRPDKYRDAIYVNLDRNLTQRTVERRLTPVLAPDAKPDSRWRRAEFGDGRQIGSYYAITGAAIKAHAQQDLTAFLRVFLAVVLVAAVVGVLGMANTLAASVLMRFREIGVLQAVGARPRSIRRMVIAESAILTTAAFLLSLVLGGLLSWMFNQGTAAQVGFAVPFVVAWRTIPVLAFLSAVIAFVAAFVPARRAERLTPVEALRYE